MVCDVCYDPLRMLFCMLLCILEAVGGRAQFASGAALRTVSAGSCACDVCWKRRGLETCAVGAVMCCVLLVHGV